MEKIAEIGKIGAVETLRATSLQWQNAPPVEARHATSLPESYRLQTARAEGQNRCIFLSHMPFADSEVVISRKTRQYDKYRKH